MDIREALNNMKDSPAVEVMEDAQPPVGSDPFDMDRLKESLLPYKNEIKGLVAQAKAHRIVDQATNVTAVEMGSQLADLRKKLESQRKIVIGPYDDIVRGINREVKGLRDPIDVATSNIKLKIKRYLAEKHEMQRRIAQKKAAEEAETRRKEMEKKRQEAIEAQKRADEEAARKQAELNELAEKEGVAPVQVQPEQIEIPELSEVVVEEIKTGPIKTDVGTGSQVSKWTYEVEDFEKIPADYIIRKLDEKKVKEEIAAGCRAIPGIRIYLDHDVRFRTK